MLVKDMTDFRAICFLRAHLKVPSLNDLEIIRRIKRELIRRRTEIDAMKRGKGKEKAIKVYAELLTNLELGNVN
ncbi:MAG: hypothetical protein NWE80_04530 [Candidatus Bathyarchaeota archaeon]|nr:hypothetical protein [Candidatus Bathyarchaeota archaeon]